MNFTQPLLKEDIQMPPKQRKLVSIFDSSRYLKDKKLPLDTNTNKSPIKGSNDNIIFPNFENIKAIENQEKEEEFYNNKITKIVDEIIKHRILIKLKKNIMSLVDGRIICFSDLIKIMCSYNSFNFRINLDELERDNLEIILDYFDIIEWNKSRYMWENKEEDLNKWFNGIGNIVELEEVKKYNKYF